MDPIAEIEGAINIAMNAIGNAISSVGTIQGAIDMALATLGQQEYLMALPIIAVEFRGLVSIITGIGSAFIGTLSVIPAIGNTIGDGLFGIFMFIQSWLMCFFQNLSNMQTCIIYYLIETIGQVLYLPVRITLWFLSLIKIDLYSMETMLWDGVELMDKIILGFVGFHVAHYPKNIRDKCYNCKRLKISSLVEHSMPLINVLSSDVPNAIMPGLMNIAKGGTQLMNPFDM